MRELRAEGSGSRLKSSGFRGLGLRSLGFKVWDSESRVQGVGLEVFGGFWVSSWLPRPCEARQFSDYVLCFKGI